jgi:DNA polymerase III alpha subunit
MRSNKYGEIILNTNDAFEALYSGKIKKLNNILFDDSDDLKKFNAAIKENFDSFPKLTIFQEAEIIDKKIFDEANQTNWFIPREAVHENLLEMLYGMCETQEQKDRVELELELFIQHGMLDLLFYLKYLVDTMREHRIVWGVGRGSSVASYVLYLIGVHKVDSLKYKLDIHEFLK